MKKGPIIFLCSITFLGSCSSTAIILKRRDEINRAALPWLSAYGISSHEATRPILYNNGVEWKKRCLELIEGAEDYIIMSLFLGHIFERGMEIWDAMEAKMAQGVRIYCILDAASYFIFYPDRTEVLPAATNYLRSRGFNITEYNPISLTHTAFLPKLLDRDHRKFWIFDGKTMALGGINIDYNAYMHPEETGDIDNMIEFASPGAIKQMLDSFANTWNSYNPNKVDPESFAIKDPSHVLGSHIWLVDNYWPSSDKITRLFDAFTLGAQKELWIVQGYAFLTPALIRRIAIASANGVKVNIVMSENAGKDLYQEAVYYSMLNLIDAGANVYLFDDPKKAFLHLKLFLADDSLVAFGSANYNFRSQTFSRELSAVYDDIHVADSARELVAFLLKNSRLVSREEARAHKSPGTFISNLLLYILG